MTLKIALTTDALRPPLTGVGHYACQLLAGLLEHSEVDQVVGVGPAGLQSGADLQQRLKNLNTVNTGPQAPSPPLRQRLFSAARSTLNALPGAGMATRRQLLKRCGNALRDCPDYLLHGPNFLLPEFAGPSVLTVHDLSHLRYPETHPPERVQWLNEQLPGALARADRIICVSAFTRDELLALDMVDKPDRLRVVHNGFDPGFHPRQGNDLSATLAQWGLLSDRYILAVGTLEPRKNLASLIDAYARLPAATARQFPLVLVGASGWKQHSLKNALARLPASHRVIATGYVSTTQLQCLLAGARLFAYLSVYEGFGLPVLEAMASGTPALISTAQALREVAGDACLTAPPADPDAIQQGLQQGLEDETLRQQCRQRGLRRADAFSWHNCVRQTMAVYRELT